MRTSSCPDCPHMDYPGSGVRYHSRSGAVARRERDGGWVIAIPHKGGLPPGVRRQWIWTDCAAIAEASILYHYIDSVGLPGAQSIVRDDRMMQEGAPVISERTITLLLDY